jgi:signal transduction histidine kinase
MIQTESARMSRLLDELLALARLEGARHVFQHLDVGTLLAETAARARALGDREVGVTCVSNVWIYGDPDLLDQALVNMVRNAFAHTRDGGHIDLSCAASPTSVTLSVTDDGPGIPAEELARIFDRFYRTQGPRPSDSGGAGLGLAITKRLVDLHGGQVAAENVSPSGARFSIILPRVEAPKDS